jgi:hypothetical protein
MKINQILGAAVAVCALGSSTAVFAGAHEGGPEITGEGACTYVEENMFAGPFDLCQEPVGPESCAALGEAGDNRDAVHSEGACPTEGLVGTCDLGGSRKNYLSGDAGGLEIGCGFQGGDWIPAE